ncbi:alpha/beta hydrolase family protein [Chromobacterium paludis]|uniref:Alpha/beta fold hydrolase n=1 Tax=Chromobacterium paludis TaxID=2605945 RepID=A0A5C1DFL9_9NEIS|nr:alpha/beta fold hydrolase [Chromobacterium paludis]QEL55446.1 alpha/beta fold hydrolase [Chromobacterium paludis]
MRLSKIIPVAIGALLAACASFTLAAGLRLVDIPATETVPALKAAIWSPCARPPETRQVTAFMVRARRDCPVEGAKLPLIVISHGFTGSMYGHHDTAEALADNGFLVVSLNHTGDSGMSMKYPWDMLAFERRPIEIKRVIDYMLGEAREASRIDASKIGVFGFSRGGFTSLVVAGAVPNFAGSEVRCKMDRPLCRQLEREAPGMRDWVHDVRVKAAAAVDPLNVFPDAASVAGIKIPVFLWISEKGGDGVEPATEAKLHPLLPTARDYKVVQNAGHFDFLAPCAEAVARHEPEICQDAPGFDRAALHRQMNEALIQFFRTALDIKA